MKLIGVVKKNRLLRAFARSSLKSIIKTHSAIAWFSPLRLMRYIRLTLAKRRKTTFIGRIPLTGCLMELDPNYWITYSWYIHANYERNLVAGLRRFLQPGMICLDIGANAGLFSLFMAKQVGNGGKVYAFEPTSETFQRLQKNIVLNSLKNITAENLAVTEQSGKVEFHVGPPELCVYNSTGEVMHPGAKSGQFTRVMVPATTIDDYCATHSINRVDCMKIDVEGAEMQVLKGMSRALKENPEIVLLLEFGQTMSAACGASVDMMAEWLGKRGFQLSIITSNGRLQPLNKVIPKNSEMVWAERPSIA